MTRRIFLKRSSQACGVLVFLPAARSIGKLAPKGEAYYEHTILAMGTTARVGVYARSEEEANHVITAAFDELKRLEALFTIFNSSSEISKLNASAGGDFLLCSRDTIDILQAAKNYSVMTNGAFDATIEPIMRLWGFRNDSNILYGLPSNSEIETALQFVGSDQIELDESKFSAPRMIDHARIQTSGAKIDTCGIAVGYALDKMIAIIKSYETKDAFIDISGDMFALGVPRGKSGWQVAIPHPSEASKIIYNTTISNEALATSGNYMSFVVFQARQFGHIMDPHAGRSAESILSSTVIAKTGLDADALSTASFVTGLQYGATRLVAVDRAGKVKLS